MRICGWYAELVSENETLTFEGIAKPFSDSKYVQRLWDKTYSDLLTYSIDEICASKHVQNFERYFIEMFSKAKRYTPMAIRTRCSSRKLLARSSITSLKSKMSMLA